MYWKNPLELNQPTDHLTTNNTKLNTFQTESKSFIENMFRKSIGNSNIFITFSQRHSQSHTIHALPIL